MTKPSLSSCLGSEGNTTSIENVKRETVSLVAFFSAPNEASTTTILALRPPAVAEFSVALTAMSKFNVVRGKTKSVLLFPSERCVPGLTNPPISLMAESASETPCEISLIAETTKSFRSISTPTKRLGFCTVLLEGSQFFEYDKVERPPQICAGLLFVSSCGGFSVIAAQSPATRAVRLGLRPSRPVITR